MQETLKLNEDVHTPRNTEAVPSTRFLMSCFNGWSMVSSSALLESETDISFAADRVGKGGMRWQENRKWERRWVFLQNLLIDLNVLLLKAAFKSLLVNNLRADFYSEKRHLHERFLNDSTSCYR